jgi:hypothetical protein
VTQAVSMQVISVHTFQSKKPVIQVPMWELFDLKDARRNRRKNSHHLKQFYILRVCEIQ